MKKISVIIVVVLFFIGPSILAQVPQPAKPAVDSTERKFIILESELKIVKANTTAIIQRLMDLKKPEKAPCIPVSNNQITGAEWVLILFPAIVFVVSLFILFHKTREFDFKEALKENDVSTISVINPYYSGQVTDPGKTDVPLTIEVTPNVVITANILNPEAQTIQTFAAQTQTGQLPAKDTQSTQAPAAQTLTDQDPAKQPQAAQTPDIKTPATLYKMDYNLSSEVYRASISRYIALISSFLIIIIAVSVCCFFLYHYIKFGCPPELGALSSVILSLGIGIVPYVANRISSGIKSNKSES